MPSHAEPHGLHAVQPRSLVELLACPEPLEEMLGAASERKQYAAGDLIFSQSEECAGLYLMLTGEFSRATRRREKRLNLGAVRAGDLVELAAVLTDGKHNYTLTATTDCAAMLFPFSTLQTAFAEYPPLRMHLLEELGREVSRAYGLVYMPRKTRVRHIGSAS